MSRCQGVGDGVMECCGSELFFFLCVDGISDCFPLEVHVSWIVMLLCEDFGECEASVVCFPNP